MTWVRIDDDFTQHPKVVQVGPFGVALQVAALCYSNRHLTDGYIPFGAVRTLLDFSGLGENTGGPVDSWSEVGAVHIADRLVKAGMWEEVPGGYRIHDYAIYQPTRAQLEAERRQKKNAGHLGGVAAAQARAQAHAEQPPKQNASTRPSSRRSSRSSRTQAAPQAESKPVPVPEPPVGEGEGEGTGTGGGSRGEATHPHPQAAASPSPPSQSDAGSAAEPDPDPDPAGRRREPGPCEHGKDPTHCWRCAPPGAPAPPEVAALREQLRHPPAGAPADADQPTSRDRG